MQQGKGSVFNLNLPVAYPLCCIMQLHNYLPRLWLDRVMFVQLLTVSHEFSISGIILIQRFHLLTLKMVLML